MELIITKEFQWNPFFNESIAKNVNIKDVIKEFSEIKNKKGEITPQGIVDHAESTKSVLHDYFEWDDNKAANQYRLGQASRMLRHINVKVIKDGEPMFIRSYEIIKRPAFEKDKTSTYKKIRTISFEDIDKIRNVIISDLNTIIDKLSLFDGCDAVVKKVEEAIDILIKVDAKIKLIEN